MATGQPSTRLIMTWGGGRSEIHKQLFVNKDQSSPELFYSFSVNTYKEISISLNSLYTRNLGGTSVEEVIPEQGLWNPKISIVSDPWTREDLLILFITLVIYHVVVVVAIEP